MAPCVYTCISVRVGTHFKITRHKLLIYEAICMIILVFACYSITSGLKTSHCNQFYIIVGHLVYQHLNEYNNSCIADTGREGGGGGVK